MFDGERLSLRRIRRGLTQVELAKKVGVSKSTVSRWEQNLCEPSTKHLVRIENILITTRDYLYGKTDNPSKNLTKEYLDKLDLIAPLPERDQKVIGILLGLPEPQKEFFYELLELYAKNHKI